MVLDFLKSTYRADYQGSGHCGPGTTFENKTNPWSELRMARKDGPDCPVPIDSRHWSKIFRKPPLAFNTKFGPMDMDQINTIYNRTRHQSIAYKAADEYAFPMHRPDPREACLESKADAIRLRAQKYDKCPQEWQDAVLWDRIQPRLLGNRPKTPSKKALVNRRPTVDQEAAERLETIRHLSKTEDLSHVFVRKCPGYGGCNPLCPPYSRLAVKEENMNKASTMKSTYRKYPTVEYVDQLRQIQGRPGTFSKTITLTYPFNPFKLDRQEKRMETISTP